MIFLKELTNRLGKEPNKVAISSRDGNLTFLQIENLSNQLAQGLLHFNKQNIVPFYLQNTRFVLPVILGIWKAGKIPMPLVSALSLNEALKRVKEVEWNSLVTDFVVTDYDFTNINVEEFDPDKNISFNYQASSPKYAYILATSGSTGVPKKVFLTEENIKWLLSELYPLIHVNSETRFLFSTPYSFDVSLTEILSPILTGAELVCLPTSPSKTESIRLIPKLINEEKITHLSLSPSFADALLTIGGPDVFKKLKFLMVAGEAFPIDLAKKLKASLKSGCRVFNLYGPTETTIYATYHEVTLNENNYVPIGKPFSGAIVKLVNQEGNKGELYIGGKGVTQGYVLDPVKRREKFISEAGINYYKTGDIVEQLDNGELVFLERMDDQVQVNGIRIELGEVKTIASEVMGVKSAVAKYQNGRIYIFYLADNDKTAEINHKLPRYLNPIIIRVPEFLYTYNRKIDAKKMIEKYYLKKQYLRNDTKDIEQELEKLLAKFNVSALKDLDSLDLVRFIIEVESAFKIEIEDAELNQINNLSQLDQLVVKKLTGNNEVKGAFASEVDLDNLKLLFDNFSAEYGSEPIIASPTAQSLFSQGKTSFSILEFDLKEASYTEIRRIYQLLTELANKVDLLNYAWFINDKKLEFRPILNSSIPFLVATGEIKRSDLEKIMYQKPGRPIFIALVDLSSSKLRLIFSHHSLDAASETLLKKRFSNLYQGDELASALPVSSFASYSKFLKKQNEQVDLAKAIEEIPETSENLNLSKDKKLLHVISFPAKVKDVDTAYIQGIYTLAKAVISERHLSQVTGKLALNIRKFKEFDAQNVLGDLHATLPWEVKATDSLADFKQRYFVTKQLYQTGIDYRYCLFNKLGKDLEFLPVLEKKWKAMNLSPNYLGEVKSVQAVIDEIWRLPFKANYITMVSCHGKMYAILYGDLLKEKNIKICLDGKDFVVQTQILENK
ncbi:AMP-binding protein [Lactobacillus jensenii]|uniref:non-ribosomal peptide synthetase n=1 Tax=Lactobacillus jensenii TaxID=109790 RepID=UPI001197E2AF|nr:AMP-binding protein [Lactobacillus jensenii]MDK7324294.1 AMP-binding protein [Lactobacillus jensenii]TVV09053.1 AMP-binding protein [Lactobacillus jensenii]